MIIVIIMIVMIIVIAAIIITMIIMIIVLIAEMNLFEPYLVLYSDSFRVSFMLAAVAFLQKCKAPDFLPLALLFFFFLHHLTDISSLLFSCDRIIFAFFFKFRHKLCKFLFANIKNPHGGKQIATYWSFSCGKFFNAKFITLFA